MIYAGPEDSSIACMIRKYEIGLVLDDKSLEDVAMQINSLSTNRDEMDVLQKSAFAVYKNYFVKKIVVDTWDRLLRQLLSDAKKSA